MALSKHVNPDRLLQDSHDKKNHYRKFTKTTGNTVNHSYGARYGTSSIPKYHIASKGIDAAAAYQLIHDELSLDGSPVLNLASFVHTWMPPEADKLMVENMSKNLIGISIIADMWHAPSAKQAIGTATTGSSEAIQLGGLAMKRIGRKKERLPGRVFMSLDQHRDGGKRPGSFGEIRQACAISVESNYRLDPKKAMEFVDENTIGIFVILGSTYTGHYEPVKEMSDLLDEFEKKTGNSVPIHEADHGNLLQPKLLWDFKLPRVVSINTSGHKFGLSYVGVGWVIWRDKAHLPKDLIFELHYLGSVEYSFSLNFSRPAAPIIAQYFNLIHLGFEGYRSVALDDLKNARVLSRSLERCGYYTVLSDIHRKVGGGAVASVKDAIGIDEGDVENYEPGLPVVSFRFSDKFQQDHPEIKQKWIQTLLRAKGWIVPNYELAPDLEQVEILRVVVRENMSEVLIDRLVCDIIEVTEGLTSQTSVEHGLTTLGNAHSSGKHAEVKEGKMDHGDGSASSGTYAKTC
ncbi:glutamate decarboxylase [Infundibulicybe gibba]|nr:glutamate decarboxylase [Infundibulicybe gibba]